MSDQNYTQNESYNELLKNYSSARSRQSGQSAGGSGAYPPARQDRPGDPGISFNRPNNEDVAPRDYRTVGAARRQPQTSRRPTGNRAGQAVSAPRAEAAPSASSRANTHAAPSAASRANAPAVPSASAGQAPDAFASSTAAVQQELKRKKTAEKKRRKRAMRRRSTIQSLLLVALVLVFVFVAAMLLKMPIMGCVNDLLAIDRDDTEIRVVVEDGMNVDGIIDLLADKGLLYSGPFCKLAAQLLDYSKDSVYPGGTYNLSSDMGLEGMLKEIMSSGVMQSTVTLTFPEGYTVDQIVAKLSENNVASAESLYEVLNGSALVEQYDFLLAIEDRADRYSIFEGYLYPDTYEFYIGEEPESVIEKFLKNFARRWTAEYSENASKLGMTLDEIITLASILEKEANDAQQMPLIASILFNRIRSTSFTFLNCDSTGTYLESIRPHVASDELYEHLTAAYDTYIKTGLPVGAICNPGADAISAAMHPESTDYYYFLHDSSGMIYVARTAEEHESNIRQYLGN